MFNVGDVVEKTGGDYVFIGTVQAVFKKRNEVMRIVVENYDGILHIFNPTQLRLWEKAYANTREPNQAQDQSSSE
jgi:hypothetical protein